MQRWDDTGANQRWDEQAQKLHMAISVGIHSLAPCAHYGSGNSSGAPTEAAPRIVGLLNALQGHLCRDVIHVHLSDSIQGLWLPASVLCINNRSDAHLKSSLSGALH